MYGVIIIAHGSKQSDAFGIVSAIAGKVRGFLKDAEVEYGFIWQTDSDFDRIFKKFDIMGIHEIVIMPYFLFNGTHVNKTIRSIADSFSLVYPHKKITITEPLGFDDRLAEIAADRILYRKRGENGI